MSGNETMRFCTCPPFISLGMSLGAIDFGRQNLMRAEDQELKIDLEWPYTCTYKGNAHKWSTEFRYDDFHALAD